MAMQLKKKHPRKFDLFTDPLYEEAASAINGHMREALKGGCKSSARPSDELEPPVVRKSLVQSDREIYFMWDFKRSSSVWRMGGGKMAQCWNGVALSR